MDSSSIHGRAETKWGPRVDKSPCKQISNVIVVPGAADSAQHAWSPRHSCGTFLFERSRDVGAFDDC